MKPLYSSTCANCLYLEDKYFDKPLCAKHHIYISDPNIIGKVSCDDFEMEHYKKKIQEKYDKIVNKLIVTDKEKIVDYILENLEYISEYDCFGILIDEEEV